jgi:DNA-binding transcriptional ArsR family regulator
MSRDTLPVGRERRTAATFAALGDETRLRLVGRLSGGAAYSITQLAEGTPLTRQAVTKHLRTLEGAGLVRCEQRGRERVFALEASRVAEMREYLAEISAMWEKRLARLKSVVE